VHSGDRSCVERQGVVLHSPIRKVARMLKNRLDRILTWFSSPISNGTSEGFNSRIQAIKSAARGFRSFEN
jgi:transposase